MRLNAANLPDHIKRMANPEDLKAIGIDPRTMEQVVEDNQVKSEKELHQQIMQELNRRGIWYCHSRTDKRTTQNCGVPDFLLCIRPGHDLLAEAVPIAIECKSATGMLSEEQEKARKQMECDGWRYFVIRSLETFIQLLKTFKS